LTKYIRDELERTLARMVNEGGSLFFAPGELEIYPRSEADGGESLVGDYRCINLSKVIAPKAILTYGELERSSFIGADIQGAE
jgi:hypothetical protein